MRRFALQVYKSVFWAALALSTRLGAIASDPNIIGEFAVARGGDAIVIPVTINGIEYRFMLDTGFSVSALDGRHRHLLGEPIGKRDMRVPGEMRQIDVYAPPVMQVGTTQLRSGPEVTAVDLTPMQGDFVKKIDGVLGADVLFHLVLHIDFDRGQVELLRTASHPVGKAIPMTIRGANRAFILAQFDGHLPCEFLIDTGSIRHNFGSMDPEGFDLLQSMDCLTLLPGTYSSFSIGKKMRTRHGRVSSISIGGFRHDGAIFERLSFWNSLGIGFLSHYVSTFDFPKRTLYLQPGERFGERDSVDGSGLNLTRNAGDVVVEKVLKRGVGEASGVRAGDVLVSVDGELVNGWSVYRIERRFCISGEHTLAVHRDGRDQLIRLLIPADRKREPAEPQSNEPATPD